MAKPVVFVIGATGTVGSGTVAALASKYADKLDIRAGVRNLDKADKLKALAGVTVVQAEMGVKEKLVETFKGVSVLYIVTPGAENKRQLTITTAEAAKTAGVEHLVVVSVSFADATDITLGQQFAEVEKDIKELGVPYTILRLPLFMETHFGLQGTIKGQSGIFWPVDPTKMVAAVAASTDAGKFGAAVLSNPSKHANKVYTVISDRYTYKDLAATFSEVLGKEIKYVKISFEELKQAVRAAGVPEWQVEPLIELQKLVDCGTPLTTFSDSDISVFTDVTGDQPTSIKTWVSQMASAFM